MEHLFEPSLAQFGPAIAWLLAKGISSEQVADLFHTTSGNIRVLAHRAGRAHEERPANIDDLALTLQPSPEEREQLRVRSHPDYVIPTRKMRARMDRLENDIQSRVSMYRRQYDFLEGAASLREILPQFGYPSHAPLIGLLAQLHQHTAWFRVHSGYASSALAHAKLALRLSRLAYWEREGSRSGRVYGQQFVDSALIGSMAFLLSSSPESAWKMLRLAEHASERIGIPIGADQYRQRGIVLFQLRNQDDEARKYFQRSAATMEKLGEAQSEAHLLMYGSRANLLDPVNWERAQEILDITREGFGRDSLEYSNNTHWTSACGLVIDSPTANQQALDLLESNQQTARRFGHQATISKLLTITPELKVYPHLRSAWVRRALYENAFRGR